MHPDLPLGRLVDYPSAYDATLLFPIARSEGRREIGLDGAALPFAGVDRWHAYELGWLDPRGTPRVATATIEVPADSPHLVESKSLKLYLNSFNSTRVADADAVRTRIIDDLSRAAGAQVSVQFGLPSIDDDGEGHADAESIDALSVDIDHYGPPRADFLCVDASRRGHETLTSALLKSNCPVTSQPDWARVTITHDGARLDREGLLRYVASFRDHCEFHEQCVERIFVDVMRAAAPAMLSVEARYTRRGGLDINPWRATPGTPRPRAGRDLRQ